MNTEDEEQVPIENNSNFKAPLSIVSVFGTLEWVIEEGWLILLKIEENNKQTLEVSEKNNSRNIIDHNLLGLFYQQVFLAKLLYFQTNKTTMTSLIHYYILCLFAKGKTKNRKGLRSKNNLPYLRCDTHRTLWFTNHR